MVGKVKGVKKGESIFESVNVCIEVSVVVCCLIGLGAPSLGE